VSPYFYLCNHEIVVENLSNIIIRTVVWGKENKYILFYSILFYADMSRHITYIIWLSDVDWVHLEEGLKRVCWLNAEI
jgi:hypothetical protein